MKPARAVLRVLVTRRRVLPFSQGAALHMRAPGLSLITTRNDFEREAHAELG